MQDRLSNNSWLCGEGPEGVTSIRPLESVISGASLTNDLLGFRGHLLASYIWLKKRMNGYNNPVEKAGLALLRKEIPSSPFYAAIDGDQAAAVDALLNFPTPYSQFWGSAPDSVIYVVSASIALEL